MTMDFVGIGEATKILGLSRTSIQKLVDSGKLPAVKTNGGHRRILRSSIEALNQKMGHKAMLRLASSNPGGMHHMTDPHPDQVQIHVLIVEDDEPTASVLVALLETHYPDIKCTVASDGLDAVLQLERVRPRILITDLNMEPFDGFRLLNMVSSRAEYRSISTVVLSGLSPEQIEQRGGLPAEVLFLPKPMSIERLRGFLDAHVQIQRQYRAMS
ncbi:MAG: response regulator [Polaromonas sp.]|nr:response regulator [Polaromonas sp.]